MARAYLHDIPIDTFIKYYLDLENDPNAISENARYQPIYEPETTDTYYKCVFDGNNTKIDNTDINGSVIPHLKINTVNFPDVCTNTAKDIRNSLSIIFNTENKLNLLYPVLKNDIKKDILYYPNETQPKSEQTNTSQLRSNSSMMNKLDFYFNKPESDVFNKIDNTTCINKFKTETGQIYEHPIYYMPIKDPITELFQYKSFYKYYAVIDNKYFYPLCFDKNIQSFNGLSHFYMDYTDDKIFNQNNYKLTDFIHNLIIDGYAGEENTKKYYDKKNNIEYFLVIDNYNNERGKIYILPELNVLKTKEDTSIGFYTDSDTGNWIIDGILTNYPAKPEFEPYVDPLTGYWVNSETNENISVINNGKSQFLKAKSIEYAYTDIYTGKEKYFSKETMPLSPIMKYHNYMRSIKKNDVLSFDNSLYESNNKLQYVEKTEKNGKSSFHLGFKFKDDIILKPFSPDTIKVSQILSYPSKVESSITKEKEVSQIIKWNKTIKTQNTNITKKIPVYVDYSFDSFSNISLKQLSEHANHTRNAKNNIKINRIQNAINIQMLKKYVGNLSSKLSIDNTDKEKFNIPIINNHEFRSALNYVLQQDLKLIPNLEHSEISELEFFINNYINVSELHLLDSDLVINLNKYITIYGSLKNIVESKEYRINKNNDYTVKLTTPQYLPIYDFLIRIKKIKKISTIKTYAFINIDKSIYAIEIPKNKTNNSITILPILVFLKNILDYYIFYSAKIPNEILKQRIHLEKLNLISTRFKEILNIQNILNIINNYITEHQSDDNNDDLYDMNFIKLKNIFKDIYLYKNIYKNMDGEKTIIRKYEDSLFNLSKLNIITENISKTPLIGITKIEEKSYLNGISINLFKILENKEKSKNKGGYCFNNYEKTGYYGFINYRNTSSVYIDTINLNNQMVQIKNNSRISNAVLSSIEKQLIKKQVEEKNPIEKILNYRLFPTDNDEINYLIYNKKMENNFKLTTNVQFVSYLEKEKSNVKSLNYKYKYQSYNDIFDKAYTLYTEYLYSNIKEDFNLSKLDNSTDNSSIAFYKKSIPLYIDIIENINNNNLYVTDDILNNNYNIKYIFNHTDNDKNIFLSALEMKLTR